MPAATIRAVDIGPGVVLGDQRLVVIAGPCVVENYETTVRTAAHLRTITDQLAMAFVFKASFDKANRTSHASFRSIGFDVALDVLARVRAEIGSPILTDVHETTQVKAVAQLVDVLQIPAFLCRQTDLIEACARTGKAVNIKRGQFMAPEDMLHAVEKVTAAGNRRTFLTERGSCFGYHDLVVDMRALPIMRQFAPVIFDVTHSVQMPGGMGTSSGGQRQFAPYLARAAAAAGVDGFFIETHPEPEKALSDGPNMIPLDEMERFLYMLKAVWEASQPYVSILSSEKP